MLSEDFCCRLSFLVLEPSVVAHLAKVWHQWRWLPGYGRDAQLIIKLSAGMVWGVQIPGANKERLRWNLIRRSEVQAFEHPSKLQPFVYYCLVDNVKLRWYQSFMSLMCTVLLYPSCMSCLMWCVLMLQEMRCQRCSSSTRQWPFTISDIVHYPCPAHYDRFDRPIDWLPKTRKRATLGRKKWTRFATTWTPVMLLGTVWCVCVCVCVCVAMCCRWGWKKLVKPNDLSMLACVFFVIPQDHVH